ncbi:MAG: PAS domain-containing protein [Terriglobales bacterium]
MAVKRIGEGSANGQISPPAAFNAFQLMAGLPESSPVGTAILDDQLRYRAVSATLAEIDGVAVDAHLGSTVRDVLGDIGEKLEPVFERILATGKPVLKEIIGYLPAKAGAGHWIANFFPVADAVGRVNRIGAIVIDVTEQKKLERSVRILSGKLLPKKRQQARFIRELHDSVTQYHAALKATLSQLVHPICQGGGQRRSPGQPLELLDHFPVVSLRSPGISSRIFLGMKSNVKMKRQLFGKIARNCKVQDELLAVLARHPEVQTKIILELANTLPFHRRLLKIAGQQR